MTTVVAAVLEQGGRILVCQRAAGGPHPLKWEFPGGKVDPGETPEQALVRELEEELGVQASEFGEIRRYEYAYPNRPPILLIFFRVGQFRAQIQNKVFAQIRWAPYNELARFDFLEGDLEFVRMLSGPAA